MALVLYSTQDMENHSTFEGVFPQCFFSPQCLGYLEMVWKPFPGLLLTLSQMILFLPSLTWSMGFLGRPLFASCQTFLLLNPLSSLLSASLNCKGKRGSGGEGEKERDREKWVRKSRLLWLTKDFSQRSKYLNVPDRNGKWCFKVGTHVLL